MKKIILLILCLFLIRAEYSAQPPVLNDSTYSSFLKAGFSSLYDFDFHKADSLISIPHKPGQRLTRFFEANYYWWAMVTGEDTEQNRTHFRTALAGSRLGIEKKKADLLTHEELFISISTYSFKARLALHEMNFIKAALYLDDCVHYLKRSFGKENEYEIFNLTSGLYNFFIAYSLKHYPIIYPYLIVAPKGNMELGLRQLKQASDSKNIFLHTEGSYFLLKIYLEMQPDAAKAIYYAGMLCNEHPYNLLYQYMYFKSYILADNLGEAKKQLEALNFKGLMNKSLSDEQRKFYLNKAQEDLKEYYSSEN